MSAGGRSSRTNVELAVIRHGPPVAALVLIVADVLTPAPGVVVAATRVVAAGVFSGAGWMAARAWGGTRIVAGLFAAVFVLCAGATALQLAGGRPAVAGTVASVAAFALFLLWSVAGRLTDLLPREPAWEVLRHVEEARAFAATLDEGKEGPYAAEILAMLAEAEPYRRSDTAEYLDLAVARWRDYLGMGPALDDPQAVADRYGELHNALKRRYHPYRAWAAHAAWSARRADG